MALPMKLYKQLGLKRSKYGARKTTCAQGHKHDSKREAEYCNELAFKVKIGAIKHYDCQYNFELWVRSSLITIHKVDFLVNTGASVEAHEVKGFETRDWKLRKKLFEALFPEIKYLVIK